MNHIKQTDLEIPLGKRTSKYRFFEIVPACLSIGAIVLLLALSLVSPTLAALYVLLLVLMTFVRAVAVAYRTIQGSVMRHKFARLSWDQLLEQLEHPKMSLKKLVMPSDDSNRGFFMRDHAKNLTRIANQPVDFPKPSGMYQGIVIALYNESYEILRPTLEAIAANNFDHQRMFVVIAYEARGGAAAQKTVAEARKQFAGKFGAFLAIEHPAKLPNEIAGKGANITFAGRQLSRFVAGETVQGQRLPQKINPKHVIVTTFDCDNRPSSQFFTSLTYEFIVRENRQQIALQPLCLFNNNIWDVPAPIRVIATGNSFFNIIGAMRPYTLRNFACHSQGLWALEQMDFWSKRTVVEDGHQFWRSYFYFNGDYEVVPFHATVGQDAVWVGSYRRSLKAQFIQLRRWTYGASDVPYVANLGFSRKFKGSKVDIFAKFCRLLEGHVSLAALAPIVALGGFAPLYLNPLAAHNSIVVNDLPLIVSHIQQIAMVGVLITIFFSLFLLPPRPKNYRRSRNILMILQWILMPLTAICYWSAASYISQVRLATAHYMGKFDVTEKRKKIVTSRHTKSRH